MGEQKKRLREGLSDHLVLHAYAVKVYFSLLLIKHFLDSVHTGSVAYPAYYTVIPKGPFPWVKTAGREADRSPASDAEVKKSGAIPPLLNKS
jgi:hypothetical protein